MKINGNTNAPRSDAPAGAATTRPAERSGGVIAPPAVTLSDASARLATGDSGTFDSGRVGQIKQAIRDGRFEVNSEIVADKLIASVRELFGPVH